MSKSLGNVLDAARTGRQTTASTRSATSCCAKSRSAATARFRFQSLITRINGELANDLGNLAQRTLSLVARNCEGRLPGSGPVTEADADAARRRRGAAGAAARARSTARLSTRRWRRCGRWCARRTPISTTRRRGRCARPILPRMGAVLRVLADGLRAVGTVLQPFMPARWACWTSSASRRRAQFRRAGLAAAGRTVLPTPQGVFPRYVDAE